MTKIVITGKENPEKKYNSSQVTLIEFYRAFNNGNIHLMSKNWDQTKEVR